MAFQWFVTALAWASVVIFFAVAIYRVVKISSLPMGLRWEVYPIPHEARARREYGGSYMEDTDWAKGHQPRSFLAEVVEFLAPEAIEIGTEILTMKKVRCPQPLRHLGILDPAALGHLPVRPLDAAADRRQPGGRRGPGLGRQRGGRDRLRVGLVGAAGLIVRRATTPDLANYTAPIDYFNLAFLAAIFVFGLISILTDPALAAHRAYFDGVVRLRPTAALVELWWSHSCSSGLSSFTCPSRRCCTTSSSISSIIRGYGTMRSR